jgi:hypothetical protein
MPRTPGTGLPVSSLATPENLIKRGTWAETEDAPEFAGEVWAAAEKTKAKKLSATAARVWNFMEIHSFRELNCALTEKRSRSNYK